MKRPLKVYLKHSRLADVLALIRVLAFDRSAHRKAGLQEELQGLPASASEWQELAYEHPEFFRVRQRGDHIVSLTSRHVRPKDAEARRPQLEADFVHRLMQTAIELHDRELKRREKWNYLFPATIAALTSIVVIVLTSYLQQSKTEPNQSQEPTPASVTPPAVQESRPR